jgi:uncharacterized membrane protein YccC
VPNGAGASLGVPVPGRRRRWAGNVHPADWLPAWSVPAALRAVRATIVVGGLFAFADKVVGNLQMATFAAFGGFATLVLASFNGSRRDKLRAHLALAVAGSVLLTIGTAVTSTTALAAAVTVPVAFAVLFAGVAGPNAASGATGALLGYILPAASPGALHMVPDRLAGWWMASVAGTAAVLLLSPRAGPDPLRGAAARLATALADELDAALRGAATAEGLAAAFAAKQQLLDRFTATPYRPTGLATPGQALDHAVELLEWCTALLADTLHEQGNLHDASTGDRELLETSIALLRDSAALLAGEEASPDLERLEHRRARSLADLQRLAPEDDGYRESAQICFHVQAISSAALAITAHALVAAGRADREWLAAERRHWFGDPGAGPPQARRATRIATVAARHASVRSVWFVNSLRGAVALAAAVAVADLSSVQHAFWVVLGALSVLRTNAASTGATALRALGGTAIGFVIGGLLILAIGSNTTVLWIALPVAVFIAAYSPGTAPFEVGQAAFTVTISVLFNLLVPVGWKLGVIRVEDVAIGCAVSIGVGLLLWPRGVSGVVGDDLADAFRAGAAYLVEAIEWACGVRSREPQGAGVATAALRVDDALRGFVAEQGAKRIPKQELWRLVGGSLRLRLTAYAISGLPPDAHGTASSREALGLRVGALAAWYDRLAELLDRPRGRPVAVLEPPELGPETVVHTSSGSHYGVWLCEHLDHLCEHLEVLVAPATHVANMRRRPWWR